MIQPQTPAATPVSATAPTPAPAIESARPTSKIWGRLRLGSPWLAAFPAAWVPVHTLMPRRCPQARGESAWDLDNWRCTAAQLLELSKVLERASKGPADVILAGLKEGNRVAIAAGHLAFTEDFTTRKRCLWHEFPMKGAK